MRSSINMAGGFYRTVRLVLKLILALGALLVAASLALPAYLYVYGRHTVRLPAPTGPYAVGRTSFDWTDEARVDQLAPHPGAKRELMVWVWYPATGSARRAPYFPEPLLSAYQKLFRNGGLVRLLVHDPALVRSHSFDNPRVAQNRSYPVVLLKPGFGSLTLQYSALAEDLASRGYVVVGTDAPYSTGVVAFPDGRVVVRSVSGSPSTSGPREPFDRLVTIWAADSSFVLNKLKALDESRASPLAGHLDLSSVGIVGHSFGGASAVQFCVHDDRCKAGIDLDGRLFGIFSAPPNHAPLMLLLTDHSGEPDQRRILSEIRQIYDRLPPGKFAVMVRGTRHFNVSDMAFLRSPIFLSRAVGGIGTIDRRRGLKITQDLVAAFFDIHLKARNSTVLQTTVASHPEVRVF